VKIGFDTRMIDHPGIGRYMRCLLKAIFDLKTDHEFILFGNKEQLSTLSPHSSTVKSVEYTASIYSLKELFFSPFAEYDLDVLHIPHFNMPFFMGRKKRKKRLIVTVHDLIYLNVHESRPFYKGIAVEIIIANAVKHANKIIAVSDSTRQDIVDYFPESENKIRVVYEAADPIFKPIDNDISKEQIRQKYNLPRDFILFVGSLKAHKNIEGLIEAYKDLKSKGMKQRLVIVGRYRPKESRILEKINQTDALYLGEVSEEELVIIYNLAAMLVMPSLYEGFGLTCLEAMACGIPMAVSEAMSLPEVVGEAAIYFDPTSRRGISKAIYRLLTEAPLRKELAEKGRDRAKAFSWKKTAQETLRVYEQAY